LGGNIVAKEQSRMAIETVCAGCQISLRVGEEHQGKQARCPVCGHIYTIPVLAAQAAPEIVFEDVRLRNDAPVAGEPILGAPSHPAQEAGASVAVEWFMKTPEGQTYGPVSRAELDRWMNEGRIAADCDVRQGGRGWMSADQLYPSLKPLAPAAGGSRAPVSRASAGQPYRAQPASARSTQAYPAGRAFFSPHRGGLVLSLGISGLVLGLFFACPVLSVMAWVMGNADLHEMRAGRMDPSGSGMTQAGQIMGMVVSLLWIAGCVIFLFVFLLVAGSNM
jgi:hypothetical protein